MKILSLSDTRQNVGIITPWSLIHYLAGLNGYFLFNKLNVKDIHVYIILIILHTMYELKDYILSYYLNLNTEWGNNSVVNSVTDTIFFLLGIITAKKIEYNDLIPITSFITFLYFIFNQKYG